MTITDTSGAIGSSAFEIVSVPSDPIMPNACGDLVITFNASATPGEYSHNYNISSDDDYTFSDPDTLHNRRMELIGSCGKLETVFVLDASGSMTLTLLTIPVPGPTPWVGPLWAWRTMPRLPLAIRPV